MLDVFFVCLVRFPALFGIVSILLVVYLLSPLWRAETHAKVPFIQYISDETGKRKVKPRSAQQLLEEGCRKFKQDVFQLPGPLGRTVVIPPRFLDDVKSLPEETLSFRSEILEQLLGGYTGVGGTAKMGPDGVETHSDVITGVITKELNRHLGQALPALQDELEYAFATTFPPCEDWTPIQVHPMLLQIVALIFGRVSLGTPTNRNPELIQTTTSFTTDILDSSRILLSYPKLLRPFAIFLIPGIRAIPKHLKTVSKILAPVVNQRLDAEKRDPGYEKPSDILQWIIDKCPMDLRDNIDFYTLGQLNLSFVATHTTTMASTHAIFDLAAMPEYQQVLRDEMDPIIAEEGGVLTQKQSLAKLRKLDSFLKESQRQNPSAILAMMRKAMVPFYLSNGILIPKGTHLATPVYMLTHDPTVLENPDVFDGFRYERMRREKGAEHKHQFEATSPDAMTFGIGTHKCPGRFLASQEIKLVMLYLIRNYDIKLEDEAAGRPANLITEFRVRPDPTKRVLLKRRVLP